MKTLLLMISKFLFTKRSGNIIFLLTIISFLGLLPMKTLGAGFNFGNSYFIPTFAIKEFNEGEYFFAAQAYNSYITDNKNPYTAVFMFNANDETLSKILRIKDKNLQKLKLDLQKFDNKLYLYGYDVGNPYSSTRKHSIYVIDGSSVIDQIDIPAQDNYKIEMLKVIEKDNVLHFYYSTNNTKTHEQGGGVYTTDGTDWHHEKYSLNGSDSRIISINTLSDTYYAKVLNDNGYYISSDGLFFEKQDKKFPIAKINKRVYGLHDFKGKSFSFRSRRLREYSSGQWNKAIVKKQLSELYAVSDNIAVYKTYERLHLEDTRWPKQKTWIMSNDGSEYYMITYNNDRGEYINFPHAIDGGIAIKMEVRIVVDGKWIDRQDYFLVSNNGFDWYELYDDSLYPEFIIDNDRVVYRDHFINIEDLSVADMSVDLIKTIAN